MRNGKVALVTGSSKGIGRGVALALAKAGYDIAVHYSTSPDEGEKTLEKVKALGVNACLLQGDTGEIEVPARLVKETVEQLGRLDVMVSNAGFTRFEPLLEITPETMDALYRVDFRGMVLMAQAAARYMVENQVRGSLIFNTSIRSFSAHSADGVYGAMKAAMNRIIESFAIDLGRYGIRVNGFSPGVTNVRVPVEDEPNDPFYKNSHRFIPLRRNGHADDMGGPVVWLASDDSSYVTGQIIRVDGGMSVMGVPEHVSDMVNMFDIRDWLKFSDEEIDESLKRPRPKQAP